MLQLTFTEAEIKERDYQQYHPTHTHTCKGRWKRYYGKAKGLPHHQIATLCWRSVKNTMRSYLQEYPEGGIEALKRLEFYQPKSELEKHHETLQAYFQRASSKLLQRVCLKQLVVTNPP